MIVGYLLFFIAFVAANTETYLLKIPHYYNIPPHPEKFDHNSVVRSLNSTDSLVEDIYIAKNSHSTPINVTYNFDNKFQRLWVRLNNYNDSTFQSDDNIYVKICWPATLPYSIDISHEYRERFNGDEFADLYLIIQYSVDVYPANREYLEDINRLQLNLQISNLSKIPIPFEIIDLILYIGDLSIFFILFGASFLKSLFNI